MIFTKRFISALCAALIFVSCSFFTASAAGTEDEENTTPIYAEDLQDGTYAIEVKSSASMFRIIDCQLNVSEGKMTAVLTLSGKGYGKLFMGKSDAAVNASDSDFIYFKENAEGKYTYTVPVESLNTDIDCAAWSIRREKWYDRVLVFKSDTLPQQAFVNKFDPAIVIIIISAAVILIAVTTAVIITKRKKNNAK